MERGVPDDLGGRERRAIHQATHIGYRPDIDGLRTLAVLPVVLNHAGVRGFSGGYIGVDIFFVISGFLITGILVRDLAVGTHTISEFYRRRVLRIFPALFVMMAVTTIVACVAMLPVELVRYARSLGATTLFASNALFYSESGYFDAASTTKPLLHTWSLAIEEQFYILWPLALAWIGAHRRATLTAMVAAVTIVSFGTATIALRHDPSATFYLLPTRAWELSIGALVALIGNPIRSRWLNELLAGASVLAILACVTRYDEFTPFPGLAALVPCAGAALLIMTGATGTLTARLLSLAPAVWIGRISYSLYLWHWPVIVFAKIALFVSPFDPMAKAVQVAISLALGFLSWRFVEQPFRTGVSGWRTPRILLGALAAMAVTLAVAAALLLAQGLPGRFTPRQRAIAATLDLDGERLYRRGTCFRLEDGATIAPSCLERRTAKPGLLLLGDSHAAHLRPGFDAVAGGYEVFQANMAGCRPMTYDRPRSGCERLANRMLREWAPAHRPAAVLLAGNWRMPDLPGLERTLADPAIRRINPVVIGPIPQYTTALPRLLVFEAEGADGRLPPGAYLTVAFEVDRSLRQVAARHGVPYISLVDTMCRGTVCRTLAAPDRPMQFDYSHLTGEASAMVIRALLPAIDRAAGRPKAIRRELP